MGGVRLDRLTSLRFVAAFVVFAFHAIVFFGASTQHWLNVLFGQGRSGVTFFFVLSGFVLAWAAKPDDTVAKVYRRRFARIYPAYLVALLFAAALWAIADWPTVWRGWLSPFLLQAWVPSNAIYFGVNIPAWSLSVEAFFYVAFPFLVRGLRRLDDRRLWVVALAMVAVSFAIGLAVMPVLDPLHLDDDSLAVWAAYYFPPARLPEFVLGMVLGLLLRRGSVPAVPWWSAGVFAGAAYLSAGIWPSTLGVVAIVVVPFAVLVVAAAQADLAGKPGPLTSRPFLVLGAISYCFYLTHHIFIMRMAQDGVRALGIDGVFAACLALVLGLVSAWLLHRFVEEPWEKRLSGRVSVTDAAGDPEPEGEPEADPDPAAR
ncbi:acyltransferase family protein [Demequina soli]|uniref:acyltransferase family protein n=1 Tax=Demequina soli TaxID=1638987 RepID=UPI000782D64C|nr:acyltransferase [Demequina soli]